MSRLREILFVGPTYAALSGERRRAFIRQWTISGIVLVISAVAAVAILAEGGKTSIAMGVFVILLALQLLYALVRGETIWQLRIKELKYLSGANKSNKKELLDFAEQLKQEGRDDDRG